MDKDIIKRNRRYLHSVKSRVAPEDCGGSRAHYGCPPLDLLIDEPPTYSGRGCSRSSFL